MLARMNFEDEGISRHGRNTRFKMNKGKKRKKQKPNIQTIHQFKRFEGVQNNYY